MVKVVFTSILAAVTQGEYDVTRAEAAFRVVLEQLVPQYSDQFKASS